MKDVLLFLAIAVVALSGALAIIDAVQLRDLGTLVVVSAGLTRILVGVIGFGLLYGLGELVESREDEA